MGRIWDALISGGALRPARRAGLRRGVLGSLAALLLAGCGAAGGALHTLPNPPASKPITGGGSSRAVWGAPLSGQSPRALIMLIHGGGWSGINPFAFKQTVRESVIFRALGFETLTVDYRAGALGVKDVDRFYRQARQRVGGKLPICAFGTSAGGHIALMLAVRHPDLACVIDQAGPTDLPSLGTDPGGAAAYKIATKRFGNSDLAKLSPALHAASIKAKLLLVYAQNDPLVPVAQGYDMARADPRARLVVLPPGSAPFVHTGVNGPVQSTGVSQTAKTSAQQAEAQLLTQISSGQA
jgi:pimeloyl-ACP methyl ester carboxylesterase